jgi:membrane protein implicated in regulation of membrane protease activity
MKISGSRVVIHFETPVFGYIDQPVKGDKPGRIRFEGTIWFARPYANGSGIGFSEEERVLIVARQGNTLLILPSTN